MLRKMYLRFVARSATARRVQIAVRGPPVVQNVTVQYLRAPLGAGPCHAHFEHFAGVALGQCIVVAEHPDPLFYCVYTAVVEDHGEIAVQGYGSQSPDGSTFLITAAADEYAGLGGSLTSTPLNEENTKYLYEFEFF